MYVFLSGLGLLVIIGLHQLLESRKVKKKKKTPSWINFKALVGPDVAPRGPYKGQGCLRLPARGRHLGFVRLGADLRLSSLQRRRPSPKVEMGTSSHNGVDLSWIPQETLNQISTCDITSCSPAPPLWSGQLLCGASSSPRHWLQSSSASVARVLLNFLPL